MSIRDWPVAERPREKLLERGVGSLTDAELLAIFLRVGVRGKSAVDMARELLVRFGGLRGLLEADRQRISQEFGLGPAKYAQLQAITELGRRHLGECLRSESALENPTVVRTYLKAQLRHERNEAFGCLFLNTKHHPLGFEILFRGSIDSATIYPRQVLKRALEHNAAALILCHNHPSGNPEPSAADIRLTRRLVDALESIEVRVLDHFIIGAGEPLSMREHGCFFSASS